MHYPPRNQKKSFEKIVFLSTFIIAAISLGYIASTGLPTVYQAIDKIKLYLNESPAPLQIDPFDYARLYQK